MDGIPEDLLPQAFKDAIGLVRTLGFRYLWIDSLCILQDSQEEWHSECGSMDRTYADAALTIAADNGPDSNCGLFQKAVLPDSWFCKFVMSSEDVASPFELLLERLPSSGLPQEQDYPSTLPPPPRRIRSPLLELEKQSYRLDGESDLQLPGSWLDKRGWTLQELLLSPKVLRFHQGQLYFQCDSSSYSDHTSSPHYDIHLESDPDLFRSETPSNKLPKAMLRQNELKFQAWQTIVEEHSRRNVSYGDDKLASLSGVAVRFASRGYQGYLAGLWINARRWKKGWQLISQLSWYCRKGDASCACTNAATSCPPSWSWASCDTPVYYFEGASAPIVDIKWTQTVPVGINPYGPVRSGEIGLEGVLLEQVGRYKGQSTHSQGVFEFIDAAEDTIITHAQGEVFMDEPQDVRVGHVGMRVFGSWISSKRLPLRQPNDEEADNNDCSTCREENPNGHGLSTVVRMILLPLSLIDRPVLENDWSWTALVLQHVPGTASTYHRIGIVRGKGRGGPALRKVKHWLNSGRRTTIMLQ